RPGGARRAPGAVALAARAAPPRGNDQGGPLTSLRRKEFRRILLIKLSAVGDVIHTLPVLVKLRARYPAARIDWLLTPAVAELVGHHPALSNVVPFHRQDYGRLWRSWSAAAGLGRLLAEPR